MDHSVTIVSPLVQVIILVNTFKYLGTPFFIVVTLSLRFSLVLVSLCFILLYRTWSLMALGVTLFLSMLEPLELSVPLLMLLRLLVQRSQMWLPL